MIRLPNVWPAVLGVFLLVACGRDKARDGASAADTLPLDTMMPMTPPDVRADSAMPPPENTSATPAPPGEISQKPAPAPAAPAPAPAPTPSPSQSKPAVKPNVDPGRAGTPPKIPSQGVTPPQDTAQASADNAPLRDQYHRAPRDTVTQVVYDGWKQYNLNCARCHGEDVLGTTIAPHLTVSLKPDGPINTKELFTQVVCHGRPEKGMPAWCPLGLDDEKINQLYAYVKARSDGKVGPGRPYVRP